MQVPTATRSCVDCEACRTWCKVFEIAQQTRSIRHGCRRRRALQARAAFTKTRGLHMMKRRGEPDLREGLGKRGENLLFFFVQADLPSLNRTVL